MQRHLVLTGPMGSGKSTLGRLLARYLRRPFLDSDEQIAAVHGISARELAALEGVEVLHSAEVEALIRALAAEDPAVIAAAAAVADSPIALSCLVEAEPILVLLESPLATLVDRLDEPGPPRRPMSPDELATNTSRRRGALLALEPELVIDTSRSSPEATAHQILYAIRAQLD